MNIKRAEGMPSAFACIEKLKSSRNFCERKEYYFYQIRQRVRSPLCFFVINAESAVSI